MKRIHHHSGVGMLLYIVKHLLPDIANAVRKLSKVLDGANMAAYKEMHQIIKYVLDSRDLGLQIEPIQGNEQPWELVCFSDSDYAGDPDSRRSVPGSVLYKYGVPILDLFIIALISTHCHYKPKEFLHSTFFSALEFYQMDCFIQGIKL